MAFKVPDIKAPRFFTRSKAVVNKDFIEKFKRRYPEYRNIKLAMFSKIMVTFHNEVVQGVIDNRDGIELPEGLGFVFIGSCQRAKRENIDFRASTLAGRKIFHQNWESDNRLMKILYSNSEVRYRLTNKQVWAFRLGKTNRKLISDAYKVRWTKYHIIPNMKGIKNMFKQGLRKTAFKEVATVLPADYNEFKMD